jgi:hypothetical protein
MTVALRDRIGTPERHPCLRLLRSDDRTGFATVDATGDDAS